MPRGPKGQKRPADVVSNAIMVAKIATGEVEEKTRKPDYEHTHRAGKIGGKSRAEKLTSEQRKQIAAKGAAARWKKREPEDAS